ncbi:hypothetical protein Hanom_Chr08g00746981 [Helianthus anomalus]
MSVRVREWSRSLLPLPPSYPPIPEDPQMGGPSNTTPVTEPTPMGFDNHIPTYPNLTRYDSSYVIVVADYTYPAPSYHPYIQSVTQNALYLPPFLPAYQIRVIQTQDTSIRLCLNHNHLNHQRPSKSSTKLWNEPDRFNDKSKEVN